ncbi:MAG TPA: hypothetical protein VF972_00880 [Actinomycetota bacterium]
MYPSSASPTLPGMIGAVVARRTNAQTAKISSHESCRSGMPTNRRLATNTT